MKRKKSSGLVTNSKINLNQDMTNIISEKKIGKDEVNNELINHDDENKNSNSNDNDGVKS
jgi:hypothetical protein